MDAQADSLRKFGVPAGGRRGEGNLAPHTVTVRFAGLLEGLLTLSEEEREDEPLINRYLRPPLCMTIHAFLCKCAYLDQFGTCAE